MQQRLQQTNYPVVVELHTRDASLADHRRFGQARQLAGVDATGQEVGLRCQSALIGRCQLVAQQRHVVQSPPNAKVVDIVGAGFGAQDAVAILVTTHHQWRQGWLIK
jgi:hypothetical protein